MKRVALVGLVLLALMSDALAGERAAAALNADDRIAIEQVIRSQLAAFETDDGEDAFGYASPDVREKFGTPEAFMLVVRERYRPVYRPRAVECDRITMSDFGPVQHLTVLGPNGAAFTAMYVMERQPDGAWRIGGCLLRPRESKAA